MEVGRGETLNSRSKSGNSHGGGQRTQAKDRPEAGDSAPSSAACAGKILPRGSLAVP